MVSASTATKNMIPLDAGFKPSKFDVLCLRGKMATQHPGNHRFRDIIQDNLNRYAQADTKIQKSVIVTEIVDMIRDVSPKGGFVKRIDGRWYIVSDLLAREKVSQSLRDSLHGMYRSSTKAKKARKDVNQQMLYDEVDQILGGSAYNHFVGRVGELTVQAESDLDFQMAFNQANIELLKAFKAQ